MNKILTRISVNELFKQQILCTTSQQRLIRLIINCFPNFISTNMSVGMVYADHIYFYTLTSWGHSIVGKFGDGEVKG